jgi:16S rRNA (adenine1518-N6/adenine1519-N6)-dimethyltransferase
MYIKAKKSLGQNFLEDETILDAIASSIEIMWKNILEVWPWYGALTEYVVKKNPNQLQLVELDTDMIKILEERIQYEWYNHTIKLHHTDVLDFVPHFWSPEWPICENRKQKTENYSLIANIPYYITSPILFHFLYDLEDTPDEMVIMMQEEVGEKILAGRKKKIHHSFLSLAMEYRCADISIVAHAPKTAFNPAPKVDSLALKFEVKSERNIEEEKKLLSLWKLAFTHPRKTLLTNLRGTYDESKIRALIEELGYNEKIRAEAIKPEDWMVFYKYI